jgi:NNP family nitrate/nitrite transporter-like MFS transporter
MSRSERRLALAMICLFAVAISTNYTNQGPLLGLIAGEFRLGSGDVGVVATAFFAGAASSMLLGGVLVDRFGSRTVVTVGFLLVVVSNVASGLLAPSFPALIAWRALGGFGGGFGFVAGAAYTRGMFLARGAHLAQGLYGAAFLLGSGITLLFIPALAGEDGDWRRAFALSGLGVGACWLAWLLLAPRPRRTAARAAGEGLAAAVRSRNSWLLGLCHMCGFGLAMVVGTWVTGYLAASFALPLTQAGAAGSLLLVTGIVARSAGGGVLERGVPPVRLIQAALGLAVLGLALMALPERPLWLALGGLLVTGLGVGLPYAAVFNGAAASSPRSPASAQAFVGWAGVLVAVFGPPIVGALLDVTGSFSAGFAVLGLFAVGVLLGTTKLTPISFAPRP